MVFFVVFFMVFLMTCVIAFFIVSLWFSLWFSLWHSLCFLYGLFIYGVLYGFLFGVLYVFFMVFFMASVRSFFSTILLFKHQSLVVFSGFLVVRKKDPWNKEAAPGLRLEHSVLRRHGSMAIKLWLTWPSTWTSAGIDHLFFVGGKKHGQKHGQQTRGHPFWLVPPQCPRPHTNHPPPPIPASGTQFVVGSLSLHGTLTQRKVEKRAESTGQLGKDFSK